MQNYQIFLNQKSLIFVKDKDSWGQKPLNNVKVFVIRELLELNFSMFFDEKETSDWLIICGELLENIFFQFKRKFHTIHAAGGLVESPENDTLFIYRNNMWDLPKGKVEEGEDFMVAAVREVNEECGLMSLRIEEKLTETYYMYLLNNEYVLKETHWYRMKSEKGQSLCPQLEEGITKVEWVEREGMPEIMKNTYPNIKLLIGKYQ